jgi:hypothetical protein
VREEDRGDVTMGFLRRGVIQLGNFNKY